MNQEQAESRESPFSDKYNTTDLARKDPFEVSEIEALADRDITENYTGVVSAVLQAALESSKGFDKTNSSSAARTILSDYFFDGKNECMIH